MDVASIAEEGRDAQSPVRGSEPLLLRAKKEPVEVAWASGKDALLPTGRLPRGGLPGKAGLEEVPGKTREVISPHRFTSQGRQR